MTNGASAEMPRYKCHKEVYALKIEAVDKNHPGGGATLVVKGGFAAIAVDAEWMKRFRAGDGDPDDLGYYVVYEDGYKSWSPTKAFEDGYDEMR